MRVKINSDQIIEKGIILGHNKKFREKIMNYSILLTRDLIDIFSITKIINGIKKSEVIFQEVGFNKGTLFVGTQNTACFMSLKRRSKKNLFFFISEKWKGGTISNFKQLRISLKKYLLTKNKKKFKKEIKFLSKKELLSYYKKYKEKTYFLGIKKMLRCPDLIFSGSVGKDEYMIKESNKLEIPVIGIVDSDIRPDGISYVIPGNDESVESIMLLLEYCLNYYINGLKTRITYFFIKAKEKEKEEEKEKRRKKKEEIENEKKREKERLERMERLENEKKKKKEHYKRMKELKKAALKKYFEENKKQRQIDGRTNNSRENDRSRFSNNRISRSGSGNWSSIRIPDFGLFKKS